MYTCMCERKEIYKLHVNFLTKEKEREKSRECHNHKPQPFPDTKRKRKPQKPNKHKLKKRTKSTKISSLFPKRGNHNAKRTEKNKFGHPYNPDMYNTEFANQLWTNITSTADCCIQSSLPMFYQIIKLEV